MSQEDLEMISDSEIKQKENEMLNPLNQENSSEKKPERPEYKNREVVILKEIFRAYDIRGIYGQTLTPEVVYIIGQALGTKAAQHGKSEIIVARDGRLSGPALFKALSKGIISTGCDVLDIGSVPTPLLYYATHTLKSNSGVMITGSHNPSNYNGLKLVFDGKTLSSDAIEALYHSVIDGDFISGEGKITQHSISENYINEIKESVFVAKPMKVVVDAGNGIAGNIAPKLLRALGCEVIELFCEVDGRFPNHHPDPSDLKNLECLIKTVKRHKADLGLAFDGDGDRLGVITNQGENVWPDRQMMLYAKDVISRNSGAQIIFDVKCTRLLPKIIEEYGGKPLMWMTGHSLIKAKMVETNAALAGEMSGHIFFKDRWYGFDDGIYTAARLLEILGRDERDVDTIFNSYPNSVNTPELKLPISEERKFQFMEQFLKSAHFPEGELSMIDGVRVDFAYGWGLIRPSNTTPYLVMRFEAENEERLIEIQHAFREQLEAVDKSLIMPF